MKHSGKVIHSLKGELHYHELSLYKTRNALKGSEHLRVGLMTELDKTTLSKQLLVAEYEGLLSISQAQLVKLREYEHSAAIAKLREEKLRASIACLESALARAQA